MRLPHRPAGAPAATPQWRRRLSAAVLGLSDTALLVEDRLDARVSVQLGWQVFDAQLAAERLAGLLADSAPVPTASARAHPETAGSASGIERTLMYPVGAAEVDRALVEVVLATLGALRTALATGASAARASQTGARLLANNLATAAAHTPGGERLREAVVALSRAALAIPDPTGTGIAAVAGPTAGLVAAPGQGDGATEGLAGRIRGWCRGDIRQPVQVAVASVLSIAVGELISPSRWYWAAITAFVIYSGTTSAGQTVSKGWQRVAGTVGGVIGGVLVAALVGGDLVWSLILIGVCIFCAFYLVRVSYGLMSFWITTMLALLYGLLGEFSVSLLLLRLQETAAGAVIGIVVAYLVLPTSTRAVAAGHARDMLDAVSAVLGHAMRHLWVPSPAEHPAQASQAELIAAAGELRTHAQLLRTSARPLTHGPLALPTRDGARRSLRIVLSCGYHARMIARICSIPTPGPGPLHDPAMSAATDAVRRTVHTLVATLPLPEPKRRVHTAGPPGDGHARRSAAPTRTGSRGSLDGSGDSRPVLDRALRAATSYPLEQRRHMLMVLAHLRGIDHATTELIHDLTDPRAARRRISLRRTLLIAGSSTS